MIRGRDRDEARARYKTEGELCDAFQRALEMWCASQKRGHWTVYPEVDGWDLLLVRDDGAQFGIEAKLRASLEVVSDVLSGRRRQRRPRWAGVLVPATTEALEFVCGELGIHVFDAGDVRMLEIDRKHAVGPIREDGIIVRGGRWEDGDGEPLELPEIPLQSGGGRPCPRTLSSWRVAALRLCILLEEKGGLSSQDFRDAGIHIQRWRDALWIERPSDERLRWTERSDGKTGRWAWYVAGPELAKHGPQVGYEAELDALRVKPAEVAHG